MDSTKRQDKISDEDLINLLENDDPNAIIQLDSEFNIYNFISTYKLKSGNDKVNLSVLYNLYNIWSKEPITKSELKNQLKDLFKVDNNDNIYLELKDSEISGMILEVLSKKRDKKETSVRYINNRLKNFLNSFSIESGDYKIQDYILYALYFKNNKKILNFDTFRLGLKNILNYKLDTHNIYWFSTNLNDKYINELLSQEEIETARKLHEKETNKKI